MDMSESLTFAYLASADVLTLIRYSSCCSLAYYFLDKQLLLLIITGGTRRDGGGGEGVGVGARVGAVSDYLYPSSRDQIF